MMRRERSLMRLVLAVIGIRECLLHMKMCQRISLTGMNHPNPSMVNDQF